MLIISSIVKYSIFFFDFSLFLAMPLQNRKADYVSTFLDKLVSWEMVESRLKKAVVRAVERDGHINTKQLRKQLLARAKSRSRGRPQQANGDAREQTSSQATKKPDSAGL